MNLFENEDASQDTGKVQRGGAEMIRDAITKWGMMHPLYVVVEFTGEEDGNPLPPQRMAGDIAHVGAYVDRITSELPGSNPKLVGFSTDKSWAKNQGEEV